MKYWTEFESYEPNIIGKKKKIDNTIFTFDIESSSYFILQNKIRPAIEYQDLTKDEQEDAEFRASMYIWQFSINDDVYYGRYWLEFVEFLKKIDKIFDGKKIIFVHNLSFEFQFMKSIFNFEKVFARKSHKVIYCKLQELNFEFRCTYFMSNCALSELAKVYKLEVKKAEGELDYTKIRNNKTILSDEELDYCEKDCLVVYHYIKDVEFVSYKNR